MEIIYKERGSGKTKDLIQRSAKNNIPILVATEIEKQNLMLKANVLGINIPFPISIKDLKDNILEREEINSIYIDNADILLPYLLGARVAGMTISKM